MNGTAGKMGKVVLVGAGPGDATLITLKGVEWLTKADVVVYDRLIDKRLLQYAPLGAELYDVGKQAGHHPVSQEGINALLLEKALQGKLVIRLKGGDPFLFGRGGEELLLLAEHGVPFEVTPGVTSALAVPAFAGIPVTHRGVSDSLHIITGHARDNGALDIPYAALSKVHGTLVFLMSTASMGEIARGLLDAGMAADTPSAVIQNGATGRQRTLHTQLDQLQDTMRQEGVQPPAIVVVGKVAALAPQFDWFSQLPLAGVRVLVTRMQEAVGVLGAQIEALGGVPIPYPCIETRPLDFSLEPGAYSLLLFTSAVGVRCFFERLQGAGLDARALHNARIAAIGPGTAKALRERGIFADFVPDTYDGAHLAAQLLQQGYLAPGAKVGLYRAKEGSPDITRFFDAHGVAYDDIAVYETLSVAQVPAALEGVDYVTFTSAGCVRAFMANMGGADVAGVKAVCIGPSSAAEAQKHGFLVYTAREATLSALVEKLAEVVNDAH